MKLWFSRIAIALLFGGLYVFNGRSNHDGLPGWPSDLNAALSSAESSGKPVVVALSASWCAVCKRLEETTLQDPKIVKQLGGFEQVRVDVDEEPEWAVRYGADLLPTLLILNPEGKVLRATVGFQDVPAFSRFLDGVETEGEPE